MTNEIAKRTAIKAAFRESWNLLNLSMQQHILNVHHWMDRSRNRMALSPGDLGFDEAAECETNCEFWRPIALEGIEDNNGWTRIEPDGSNLPSVNSEVDVIEDGKEYRAYFNAKERQFTSRGCFYLPTHYIIIEKRKMPVY